MDISVVIPTYNRAEKLPGLLEAWGVVRDSTDCSFELIFSDDGSDDNSLSILRSCNDLPITLLENDHGGASSARNHAIKQAAGNRLIFVGDDIYPEPGFIQKHYDLGKRYGDHVAILGSVDWHPDQKHPYLLDHITEVGNEQFSFNRIKANAYTDFRHFYTCNVSVTRSMLESVDIKFDERFYKVNFEDIELSYRLCEMGMKIMYAPDIFGYHFHEYSAGRFCNRQAIAGEMAVVFRDLHPEVDQMLGVTAATDEYSKFLASRNISDVLSAGFDVSDLLKVCEDLESELSSATCQDEELVKKILSLIYERLFKLKFVEGILLKKRGGDSEVIYNYLLNKFFDASFESSIAAEFSYYLVGKRSAFILLYYSIFGSLSAGDERSGKVYGIISPICTEAVLHSRSEFRFIVKNRLVNYLKKLYFLRMLKYKYDSIRRLMHSSCN